MALNHSAMTSKRGDQYYALDRDASENARLATQHAVLTRSIGYLIHPCIPVTDPNLRIADFATGTGIWLTEVSKILPPTCELIGFDISSALFPSASSLPGNVSFREHDILQPLPEIYHATFDIIAVRALITVLAGDEWDKAVANLVPLLKPGGWLQWLDVPMTPNNLKALQSKPMASLTALHKTIAAVNAWAALLGKTLDGCMRLPEAFRASGLKLVNHDVFSTDNDPTTRMDWSLEMVMAHKAIFRRFADLEGGISQNEAKELGEAMEREILGGAYLRFGVDIYVGRRGLEIDSEGL